ncbi:MAG: hypothetical protein JWS12_335 [Candidatus Saccharibacteria bacterium]|nr:hypothetical protein [Candidatus Saccharibacteria bacterium]
MAELDRLKELPEVTNHYGEILTAGQELVDSFSIKPEFFDDKSRSVIFTSLAYSLSETKEESGLTWTEINSRRQFIGDATFLLSKNYSDLHEVQKLKNQHSYQEAGNTQKLSAEAELKVLNKYTDAPETTRLEGMIKRRGIFLEVAQKLGIKSNEIDPVNLHVLNIGHGTEAVHFDLEADGLSWPEAYDWAKGLEARGNKFAHEFPYGNLLVRATGFSYTINGGQHIFLRFEPAEILLAEESGVALKENTKERQLTRALGSLKHEFVHSQKDELVEDEFGKSLEERRAEYFSGDNGEYFEEKRFFNLLGILTGVHVTKLMDKQAQVRAQGGNMNLYYELAKTYGLGMVAKIAAVRPSVYTNHAQSDFTKSMLTNLGSYDDVVVEMGRLLNNQQIIEAKEQLVYTMESQKQKSVKVNTTNTYLKPVLEILGVPQRVS